MNANGKVSVFNWEFGWLQLFSTLKIPYFERENNDNSAFILRCVFINESSVNSCIEFTMLPRAVNK